MNPLMAMDCIACAVMPTAAWLTPVAVQNRITRSCAVSGGVAFCHSYSRRQLLANAAIAASRLVTVRRRARYAAGGGGGGFGGLGGGGFGGFGGNMSNLFPTMAAPAAA